MNQSGRGSMPCMKVSGGRFDAGARKHLCRLSGPWIARKTRSSGSTLTSKSFASAVRCAMSACGVAGVGDHHETLLAQPGDDQIVDDAGLIVEEEG